MRYEVIIGATPFRATDEEEDFTPTLLNWEVRCNVV
jgi:hypothetical protein